MMATEKWWAMARRDYGSGSVYKRASDGRWVGTVELGWANGKRKRKTVSAKTKAEAVRKLRDVDPATVVVNAPTVAEWMQSWLTDICGPRLAPRALVSYRAYVTKQITPHLGRTRLDKLAPVQLVRWHQTLRASKSYRGEPLAESTVLRSHMILSKALNDAVRLGLLPRNPCDQVDKPGSETADVEFLDAAQAAALLKHVADDPLASRWAFALLTGQRQGECLGLRWSHLDLDKGLVDVSWQLQRLPQRHGCGGTCGRNLAGYCPSKELVVRPNYEYIQLDGPMCLVRPKRRKRRIVPLIPYMVAWLRQYRKDHPPGPHDLVWSRDGRPRGLEDDRGDWYAILKDAGLPKVKLHSARHSCVSLLFSLGVTETVVMQIVGHSVVATTRGYAHVDVEAARGALRRLGQVLQLEELPAEP